MSDSEIFDNYASVMREQGLITEADYADARIGSDDISTIEALYGIKPNDTDKTHIVDQAHPDMAVVSPSYDRMNGVVENLRERQNVMVGIALKPPNGNLTQRRYVHAKKELLDELVRVGFMMDAKDEEVLTKLADSCSERLVKEAIGPLAIGGAALLIGSVGMGLSALVNFAKPSDQGVLNNLISVFEQIEEARDSVPHIKAEVDFLENKILRPFEQYVMAFENLEPVNVNAANPTLEDVKIVSQDPDTKSREVAIGNYIKACKAMMKIVPRFIRLFNEAAKTPRQEQSSRWYAHIQELVGEHFWPPEAKDVAMYLQVLKESCAKSIRNITAINNIVKQRTMDLASVMKEETPTPPPAQPSQANKPSLESEMTSELETELGKV